MSRKIPVCAAIVVSVLIVALPLAFHVWPDPASLAKNAVAVESPPPNRKANLTKIASSIELPHPALATAFITGLRVAKELRKSGSAQKQSSEQASAEHTSGVQSSDLIRTLTSASVSTGSVQRLSPEERRFLYFDEMLKKDYLPFYESVAVDPHVRDSIHALLLDERLTAQDIYDLSRKQNLSYEQHSKLRNDVAEQMRTAVKKVLPAEQYAEFLKYRGTLIATKMTGETMKQLSAQNIPYTPDTSEILMSLLKTYPPGLSKVDPITANLANRWLTLQQASVLKEVLDKNYLRR